MVEDPSICNCDLGPWTTTSTDPVCRVHRQFAVDPVITNIGLATTKEPERKKLSEIITMKYGNRRERRKRAAELRRLERKR